MSFLNPDYIRSTDGLNSDSTWIRIGYSDKKKLNKLIYIWTRTGFSLKLKHSHFIVYRYSILPKLDVERRYRPVHKVTFVLYLGLFDTGAQRLVEWFILLVVEWVEEINAMLIHLRKIKKI